MHRNRVLSTHHRIALWGLAGLCSIGGAFAQEPPTQPTPPVDPFVKKAAKPDPQAAAAKPISIPSDLHFGMAIISIPTQEYQNLMLQSAPSSAIYKRAKELLSSGQATLEDVESITTHNGQRAVVTSVDELQVPRSYTAPLNGSSTPQPSQSTLASTGYTWEMDAVAPPGQMTTQVNTAIEQPQLLRYIGWKTGAAEPSQWQPEIEDRRLTLSAALAGPDPQFLGTFTHAESTFPKEGPPSAPTVQLVFLRSQQTKYDKPLTSEPATSKTNNLRITCTYYSLDRKLALALLMDGATLGDTLHQAVLKQVNEQTATLEKVASMVTRSGQRVATGETIRFQHPVDAPAASAESVKTQDTGKSPAAQPKGYFTDFDTRNLGWRFEAEPVLDDKSGIVDLNISCELSHYRGEQDKPAPDLPDQPAFDNQELVSSLFLTPGHYSLLGTFNPPHNTGLKRGDDGKVWFAFVSVTLD